MGKQCRGNGTWRRFGETHRQDIVRGTQHRVGILVGRNLDDIRRFADTPFPRISYDEAVRRLQEKGVEIEWGEDLDYSKEKILTQDFDVPHFLTNYPKIAKPFYQS